MKNQCNSCCAFYDEDPHDISFCLYKKEYLYNEEECNDYVEWATLIQAYKIYKVIKEQEHESNS